MAKDVKLSSKIQPLICSRINEMVVMQKTNIDAIVERKLCPDVIPEYNTNTVQFVSLYWEIAAKDEKIVCDFYLKFREKGRYYCAATSTNLPVSFFVAPFYIGMAKKTPKIQRLTELALNDEDMFNRLKDILCERFPGISRSYMEQSRNVTICEILPDENKPCEQSISAKQFLEGYQNNYLAAYNSKVADIVNNKYPEGSTLHFKFGGLKLNQAYGGNVYVSYRLLLDGEYISSVYKIGTFSYPVLASAYMEDIVQDFEVKCTRQIVSRQHKPKYEDKIELIKSNGCLTYRAYSPKMARKLTESQKEMVPISSIIAYDWPAENYGVFSKMLRRKQRCYQTEMQPFSEMSSEPHIAEWLNDFILHDAENNEDIHLTDLQKQDINRLIQKRYGLIQWEQGSGKTLAGIAVGTYRMQEQNAFCTWVISPAISIKNTWEVAMQNYGKPYIMLTRSSDLDNIQQGDFVLVTLNMLCKYRKQIKKWIRMHNQKVAFCFDESDEMSNPNSRRTKAALSCFRRCKFKLLMTGTTTRNNISEFAPQLEMLYNNSYNMMSWSQTVYHFNRGKKDEEPGLQEGRNLYFGKPIPAYKAGYSLFSASHLPEKVTVFGVGQKTQDIYNADELNDILTHTVITRTFEEITGKDIKHIHQVPVQFSFAEKAVYQKAINEFHSMRANYFRSTGNSRKDSMMRLIQQITLLLRISAAPNTVTEYTGEMPVKIAKVMEMLQDMPDDIVAIGVRHKIVVDAYAAAIRSVMPDRPLFVVTGDTTTIAQRRKLRQTLKESGNGILLCTQQSLPSSVNFEYVDKVIIPELHYNNSRMSQFYMRFVRFTSQHEKDIYFVTYLGSIESNQMQMVLAKEKINLFMRGKETDLDEIYETFGVDYNLLEALMRREEDKDGHFQIHWGQQEIS